LTPSPTAARRRLTRSADFDAVYRRGRSRSSRHLVLSLFPRDDADAARVGVAVPKKVGNAVVRNRVKRQLREAVAQPGFPLPAGADVVIVARAGAAEAIEGNGFSWLVSELRALLVGEGAPA
jgi:ribonuclease P protein component